MLLFKFFDPAAVIRLIEQEKVSTILGVPTMMVGLLEALAEVAVVGLPDPKWGEIVACFFRSERNQEVDHKILHRHCREHLAPQKTPVVWCRVEAFPLTGSGKIQKFVLRDKYLAGDYA